MRFEQFGGEGHSHEWHLVERLSLWLAPEYLAHMCALNIPVEEGQHDDIELQSLGTVDSQNAYRINDGRGGNGGFGGFLLPVLKEGGNVRDTLLGELIYLILEGS